jgi:hypothetical protein
VGELDWLLAAGLLFLHVPISMAYIDPFINRKLLALNERFKKEAGIFCEDVKIR